MAGRGNGTREESWLEKGADKRWVTGHGERRSTTDTVAERIGSSEENRVKMSAFQLLCGIFASNPC